MKAFSRHRWLLGTLVLMVLLSCKTKTTQDKPLIVVSIYPYEILLREMLGNAADVVSIIPPSASPHDWSPNPSNLNAINKATLIITNGLDLEQSLVQALKQHSANHLILAEMIEVHPNHMEADEHGHDIDPHIWTSPRYLKQLVAALEPRLQKEFPLSADSIAAAGQRIISQLDSIDAQIKQDVASYEDPAIITYHNSFGYFLDEYGIRHLASVQSSPSKEPTPKELSNLGRLIKANGIEAIFVEPQMSQRSAEILAKEFKLKILILDPIGNSLGADTIGDFLLVNWKTMKLGLKPKLATAE